MAYFAKLDENNTVIMVDCVDNHIITGADGVEDEQKGIDFLNRIYGEESRYKQTSYNTRRGVHQLGGTPFRANSCGVGWVYSEQHDIFHPAKPFPSWTLDEVKGQWNPPEPYPEHIKGEPPPNYQWNEDDQQWDEVEMPSE